MINTFSNEKFIIPEYKIDLLNKSKKIINTVENINSIITINKKNNFKQSESKTKTTLKSKDKDKVKKIKTKKKIRTLWVRRKKIKSAL